MNMCPPHETVSNRRSADSRIDYALRVLIPDSREAVRVRYGNDEPPGPDPELRILPSGFFGVDYGTEASLPTLPLAELEGLPILFGRPHIDQQGNTLIIHADIVASAYYLLTRYEEWVRSDVRDHHGRFPGRESLPYRAKFIDRPLVDEYAAFLRKCARTVGLELPSPKQQFSVLLTHDVDSINVPHSPVVAAKSLGGALLGKWSWSSAIRTSGASVGLCADPLDNLDELIRLDCTLTEGRPEQCKAIYFFMAGGRTRFDGLYDIRSARARGWIERVKSSGGHIGLHTSYEAGEHPELVSEERSTLEEVAAVPITANRHHFLAWREPDDGHQLRSAGITWDSTLGYSDVAGFRLGTCRPIPLFCPVRQEPLGIEEHPLIVMDCTLSRDCDMNLSEDAAFDYVRELIDTTRRYQGQFVALWHNSRIAATDPIYPYHARLYERLLKHLGNLLDCDDL